MHRSLVFLASSLVTVSLATWAGCKGGSSSAGTAGQTTTTTTTTTSDAGMGGGSTCAGIGPDGVCDLQMGEDCNCVDCLGTAYCDPGQCLHGGDAGVYKCDHLYDSCVCPNCAEDAYCGDPYLGNCKDAGACDPFIEGCHCPNCWTYPACQASVAACAGGKPDGVCDRTKEDCSCVDCQGTPLCVPCMNGGACTAGEPCYCADCIHDMLCNDPAYCMDDGICAAHIEGCECNDCKDLPECAYRLDAGADAPENDAAPDAGLDAADAGG